MTNGRLLGLLALTLMACTRETAPGKGGAAPVKDTTNERLQASLSALAASADGVVAITVSMPARGVSAAVNGDRPLPMMSVFKLPLAVVTLAAVDSGQRTLAELVPIGAGEIRSNVSPVADAWKNGERTPTLETLVRRAVQDSDNTAGDKLVTLNGGGPAVTARLRALGAAGVEVVEEEIDMAARLQCDGTPRPATGWTEAALLACPKRAATAAAEAAQHETESSPNRATTNALATLLTKLDRGELLRPASTSWLLTTLAGTTTGPARLKGELPPGTRVLHKTGTGDTIAGLAIATNDVGLVELPDGSRFAIAVLTGGSRKDAAVREAVIARAARIAWDALVPRPNAE